MNGLNMKQVIAQLMTALPERDEDRALFHHLDLKHWLESKRTGKTLQELVLQKAG